MTPKEYKRQEIKKFLDAKQDSINEAEDSSKLSSEMYAKKHKLVSYEACKRKLGLLK